jgi:hypothetical protein
MQLLEFVLGVVSACKISAIRLVVSLCLWRGNCHSVEESKTIPNTVPLVEGPNAFSNFGQGGAKGNLCSH